ncbi:hypothetical protein PNOK_0775900 [Pyrrhoderma noxium]|uniref:HMG box domain-containing protein n=1 Tax=Pyrrhoderma noxium TaxID=2282107 RepID=A0A286U9B1_9AGAM|nr:hypothetical protein PNOK_0775900 [Pyrrhoderma noxium]
MSVTVPKRSLNAFFVFRSYINKKVQFPDWTHQNDISRYAGQLWRKMGTEEKSEFYRLAEEERLQGSQPLYKRKCTRNNSRGGNGNRKTGQSIQVVDTGCGSTSKSSSYVDSLPNANTNLMTDVPLLPYPITHTQDPLHITYFTRALSSLSFSNITLAVPKPVYAFPSWIFNNDKLESPPIMDVPRRTNLLNQSLEYTDISLVPFN